MNSDERIKKEIEHGRFIAGRGEEIWNWSSPAGKMRWERRCTMFRDFLRNEGKRVLEVGCGTGLFTQEICGSENEIVAIDISDDLIKIAKERLKEEKVVFCVENAYATRFDDESFDIIIGSSSLHHLDVEKALVEFYRLLRKDGRFMFTEPNMLNPQIAVQKNIPYIKKLAGDSPDETAFFRWVLARKLGEAGFSDISITPFDFVHPALPLTLLRPILPFLHLIEKIPFVKEFAGSLIIQGGKT